MKKIYSALLSASLILLFYGCKKEDAMDPWQGVYKTAATLKVDAPRLYTSNGVITDAQFIKDFLARDIIQPFGTRDTGFQFNQSTEPNSMPLDIRITEDSAYATSYYAGQGMLLKYIPRPLSATELVLQRTDTAIVYMYNSSPFLKKSLELSYHLEKNNTAPIDYSNPYVARFRPSATLLQQEGRIIVPVMRTHIHLPTEISWYNNAWIYLNPNITGRLQPGDTLVVQTKWLELVKQ